MITRRFRTQLWERIKRQSCLVKWLTAELLQAGGSQTRGTLGSGLLCAGCPGAPGLLVWSTGVRGDEEHGSGEGVGGAAT